MSTRYRQTIEPLEARQLLAAFAQSFTFQPNGQTPGGWMADVGKKFSEQNGLIYGWDKDNSAWMHNRRTEAKLRYDTLAFVGQETGASRWEVEVPNGLYRVKIMAGDAKYTNSRYAFDVEDRTIINRKPTKASRWMKGEGLVWVSDGRLTLTSASAAVNNKINSIEVRQVDPHATAADDVTPEINPFSLTGLVQNEMAPGLAIPIMHELGTKNVKLWYEIRGWDDEPSAWDFRNIAKYKKAGFTVTVTFHRRDVPESAEQVRSFFQRLVDYPNATNLVDFWQIGNEPNLEAFWTGSVQEFVDLQLAPAYDVLQPLGEPVIGGGVTYNVDYVRELMTAGYADHVDYAGFHPYNQSGAGVVEVAQQAKVAFGGLPVIFTEWNVVWSEWDPVGHAREIGIAAQGLKDIAYMNFYYALESDETHVGKAGAVHPDGTRNDDFWTNVFGWKI